MNLQLSLLFLLISLSFLSSLSLKANYAGSTFFNNWNFFNASDPTHGFVNYTSKTQAQALGLFKVANNSAFIYPDSTHIPSSGGRPSVRLESIASWTRGLFVIDLAHMPYGCGTWPAFWMVGSNWPNGGEIDIIEGVNKQTYDQVTLHTSSGCSMAGVNTTTFTGTWLKGPTGLNATDCYINAPNQYSNQGCSVNVGSGTIGSTLNTNGGGVFATQWTTTGIKTWFFNRTSIPADLKNNTPNVTAWGKPRTNFVLGTNCPSSKFGAQRIIINLTFCGDWAGATFANDCPNMGLCNDYVKNNPSAFSNAFWQINYVKVFQ